MRGRQLIELDWMAGTVAGVLVLILRNWLTVLYRLPGTVVLVLGLANVAYASVSFMIARSSRGELVPFLRVVAAANMLWAAACLTLAAVWADRASMFGIGGLVGEALFVGTLGILEWRAGGPVRNASVVGP